MTINEQDPGLAFSHIEIANVHNFGISTGLLDLVDAEASNPAHIEKLVFVFRPTFIHIIPLE